MLCIIHGMQGSMWLAFITRAITCFALFTACKEACDWVQCWNKTLMKLRWIFFILFVMSFLNTRLSILVCEKNFRIRFDRDSLTSVILQDICPYVYVTISYNVIIISTRIFFKIYFSVAEHWLQNGGVMCCEWLCAVLSLLSSFIAIVSHCPSHRNAVIRFHSFQCLPRTTYHTVCFGRKSQAGYYVFKSHASWQLDIMVYLAFLSLFVAAPALM